MDHDSTFLKHGVGTDLALKEIQSFVKEIKIMQEMQSVLRLGQELRYREARRTFGVDGNGASAHTHRST